MAPCPNQPISCRTSHSCTRAYEYIYQLSIPFAEVPWFDVSGCRSSTGQHLAMISSFSQRTAYLHTATSVHEHTHGQHTAHRRQQHGLHIPASSIQDLRPLQAHSFRFGSPAFGTPSSHTGCFKLSEGVVPQRACSKLDLTPACGSGAVYAGTRCLSGRGLCIAGSEDLRCNDHLCRVPLVECLGQHYPTFALHHLRASKIEVTVASQLDVSSLFGAISNWGRE